MMSVIALAGIGALGLASQTARAQQASTPVEVFGRLPWLEDVVVSPQGTKLAFVRTAEDKRTLMVSALQRPEVLGGVRVGDTKLREVKWIDDDNLLITISSTSPPPMGYMGATREWYQLATYTVSKKSLQHVSFKLPEIQTFNVSIGPTEVRDVGGQPMLYAVGYYQSDRLLPGLFSFSIPGERTRLVARGTELDTDWLIDQSGQVAAQFIYHDNKKLWEIRAHKDERMELVASGSAAIDTPRILGFNADGTAIIVREPHNGDYFWRPLFLKDGSWGPPLANGEIFARVIEDRKTGRIIGGVREFGDTHTFFSTTSCRRIGTPCCAPSPTNGLSWSRTPTTTQKFCSRYSARRMAISTRYTIGIPTKRRYWARFTTA
jgi:hypothetical protein